MAVSRGLPTKEEEDMGGEVISSEGEGDSPAHQNFEEALFSQSWVTEEWRHHLTISVMYSFLFRHFHLILHHISFEILISS